jgi:predicted MFS family arabinose efflux permease
MAVLSSPLQSRAFRRVWAGATVSSAGDAASWIALVALALGSVHASLPLLAALYTAPVAVGGLVSGWALDRFDRRLLLILDSVLRGAVFATVPLAAAVGHLTPIHIYVVAATYGALKMTSLAGFPSIIPSLVPAELLNQANALEGVSFGLASLTGAALAGVAIASIGPVPVIAFDVVSYLAFALALVTVRFSDTEEPEPGEDAQRVGFGPVVKAVIRHPWLRDLTVMFALFNIGDGALLVLLPHRAVDLGLGVGGYGLFVAAMTGGELVASIVLVRRPWRFSLPASIVLAQLAAALLLLGLILNRAVTTFLILFALGLCTAPMTAWAQTLRMSAVRADQRGRLFALLRTLMQATPPIGAGLAGAVLPRGLAVSVTAIAAVMGAPALVLAPDLLSSTPTPT